jgi:ribosomal protein S18 acetylase RimI-like enzyme
VEIRPFRRDDTDAVVALWRRCGLTRPWNDPLADIERKLADSPQLLLVGTSAGRVITSLMVGYDGHRGWLNYLAVDPDEQRRGHGAVMVAAAERHLLALGCAKVNLQIREDNNDARAFYEASGYSEDPVLSFGKRLIADR